MNETCVHCKKANKSNSCGQFWYLKDYFKMNGLWCSKCYDLIAHDGYDNPKNPTEYLMILLKQNSANGCT